MGLMNSITGYITQLLTQHVGQFAFLGQAMFLSLATIMIVWFGLKSALAASEHGSGFHFGNFTSLVMMIAFGYAMTQYYDVPIPGIGRSFYHLIIDETEYLSRLITNTQLQNASDAISQYQGQIQSPGITDIAGNVAYILDLIIMALWQAVAIVITIYGFVAQAICILVGPVFIPFFIVPKLEWLFWGWLKCFMQYAFYQVIAAATMFVIGNLVIFVLTQPPFLPVPDPVTLLSLLTVVFLGGVYCLLKVPTLTSHIFSGMSGLSSVDLAEYLLS
ncbi:MAG TPA: type IV secretion system protein [Terriglobales bacterium]|nr:type IV secretion system protein [Terriglobales bacterium]